MKAEHRHHLKSNVVAESLSKAYESLKQGPSRLGWILLALAAVILIVFFVWRYFARSGEENTSTLWTRWDELSTPGQVKAFAENKENANRPPTRVARFQEARMDLAFGLQERGSGGKSARERLQQAAKIYEELSKDSGLLPAQVIDALHGAAKAYEGLLDSGKAQEFYQKIIDRFPDKDAAADARKEIERLKKAEPEDLKKLSEELDPSEKPAGTP